MRRYNFTPLTKSPEGQQMYTTVKYPEIPRSTEDIYIYTVVAIR